MDLDLDLALAYHLLPLMLADREKWNEVQDVNSEGHTMAEQFVNGLEYFSKSLRNFRMQVAGILELNLEPLRRRSADAYAFAYAKYFTDVEAAGAFLFGLQEFEQSFPTQIKFVPMVHPTENGGVILAEKAEFNCLAHFLYTDFYRGLMAGNAPRRYPRAERVREGV